MTEIVNSSTAITVATATREATSVSSPGSQFQMNPPTQEKKRQLPGTPDPDSLVIALSPKTLLATNRFVCEICNKGFQRDQNLQLHRRGHNLPWKLKQRNSKEAIRKKVYVCPEPTCVHHKPDRALGDLTGIKKHFSRKHGEKKYKCERCSKKYAVRSDWKAHSKTCGTREYKCHCGTIFSRDSFITHRAFCDLLAEESARTQTQTLEIASGEGNPSAKTVVASPPPPPLTPSTGVVSPGFSIQSSEVSENPMSHSPPRSVATTPSTASTSTTSVFATVFSSSAISQPIQAPAPSSISNQIFALACSDCPSASGIGIEPTSLSLSPSLYLSSNSLFSKPESSHIHYAPSPQPAVMSATALLQKAAQIGASSTSPSLLRGQDGQNQQFNNSASAAAGLGIGSKPTTLDLLGLGIGAGGASISTGLSALLSSFGGGFNAGPSAASYGSGGRRSSLGGPWEGPPERKASSSAFP